MHVYHLRHPLKPMSKQTLPTSQVKPKILTSAGPGAVEDQTEIKRIAERNQYLFDIFSSSLSSLIDNPRFMKIMSGRVESLWQKIVEIHGGRYFFNLDYLYRTFQTYESYVREIQSQFYPAICMALFLQRIGGRSSNIAMNAEKAAKILSEDFAIERQTTKRVEDLIKSLINLNGAPEDDIKMVILKNLVLSHLGVDYETFLKYQEEIYKEKYNLTRPEHYRCQIAICQEILKNNIIFQCMSFRNDFETQTRINLIKYLKVLESKLEIYNKAVDSDATKIAKIKSRQEEELAQQVLENEGYCG